MPGYTFDQLIDVAQIQRLLSLFYKAENIFSGIISPDGKIIAAAGWQDICTKFHRVHTISAQRCVLNDGIFKSLAGKYNKYYEIKCANGLYDIAIPILIGNSHVATLLIGQFFYEDEGIDKQFFLRQAQEFGFDQVTYMEALEKVPVVNRGKIKAVVVYLNSFVNFLSMLAQKNLNLINEVNERKRAEDALREKEQRLELALHGANLGMWDWKIDTGDVILDYRWIAMLGYSLYEIKPHFSTWESLIHPDDLQDVKSAIHDHLEGKSKTFFSEHRLKTKSGKWKWFLSQGKIVEYGQNSKPVRLTGTIMDITDRKNAESERENLIRQLAEKNVEMERYNYTVTHDLKSPLITVKEFLKILERDISANNKGNIHFYIARIKNACEKMGTMLDQLLELSKIKRITNPFEELSFCSLVREVVDLISGEIAGKNIKIDIDPDMPNVYGDKSRISSLIQNLIDNAVKFMGDQPEPYIKIGFLPSHTYKNKGVFYVQDNGMGIEHSFKEKVFGLFEKLNPQIKGTGLGLALAKRITDLHGGKIWAESQGTGKGAIFKFTLPLSGKQQSKPIAQPTHHSDNLLQ